jgi:pilus assembly protein CpaC
MRNWLRRTVSPIALGAFVLGMAAASGQTPTTPTNEKFLKRTSAWELTGTKTKAAAAEGADSRDTIIRTAGETKTPLPSETPPTNNPLMTPPGLPLTPTPHITANAAKYIKQLPGPDNVLEVVVGRIQNFALLKTPSRIQVGDETIANTALLSPKEVTLQGLKVGTTVLNIWFKDDAGKSEMVGFLVRVLPDPDARGRLERAYKNLEKEVNRAFPNSRVYLTLVGDKLTVYGQARDIAEANMIMRMVQSNVLRETADSPDLGRPGTDPSNESRILPAMHRQVVNMLRVIGEQQVMLQVQVVEVNRAAARSIGLNFGAFRNAGSFFVGGTTGNLGLQGQGGFSAFNVGQNQNIGLTGLGGIANLPVALDFGQIQLAIAALRNLSYARYLAEPNLVAINGQTANFQAGSLLPVPVITGGGNLFAGNLQGVNFVPLGVQLAFTPFITDRDRVRLTINAEISDRDTNVVPTIIDGAAIPSLVTRNFNTTVELREGQTLAVAGLIESKLDNDSNRLPFIWHIPVLNRLAGYDRIGNREKELVILVTPRLVRPLECEDVPKLPGVDLLEPNDFEFYVLGRMESHTGSDFRSPVRTDKSRKYQRFRFMEHTMLIGPSGPTHEAPGSVDAPMPNKLVPNPMDSAPGRDVLPNPGTVPPANPAAAPMGKLPASLSGLEGGSPVTVTPADAQDVRPTGGMPGGNSTSLPPQPVSRWNR